MHNLGVRYLSLYHIIKRTLLSLIDLSARTRTSTTPSSVGEGLTMDDKEFISFTQQISIQQTTFLGSEGSATMDGTTSNEKA
jgi:hypothetical protein